MINGNFFIKIKYNNADDPVVIKLFIVIYYCSKFCSSYMCSFICALTCFIHVSYINVSCHI